MKLLIWGIALITLPMLKMFGFIDWSWWWLVPIELAIAIIGAFAFANEITKVS